MEYKEIVQISREEYDRVNRLLALSSLEEMTDDELIAAGANTNYYKNIYHVKFKDGSELCYNLCSGTSNYYDDVMWNNDCMDIVLDCTFELGDITFNVEGNQYTVSLDVKE